MLMVIALLAATAHPKPPPIAVEVMEAAYIAGRCTVWMDEPTRVDVEKSIDAVDPHVREMYNEGVNDSNREGIRYDVCAKLLNDAQTRLAKY